MIEQTKEKLEAQNSLQEFAKKNQIKIYFHCCL